jgi:hypothetical protein
MNDRLLELARRLHALARTGLHFSASEYDRERYVEIERSRPSCSRARYAVSLERCWSSGRRRRAT